MPFIRNLFILFLCGLLLVTQWGCVRTTTSQPQPSLGVIGVTTGQFIPELDDPTVINVKPGTSSFWRGFGPPLPVLFALALLFLLAYGSYQMLDALFDFSEDSQGIPKSSQDDQNSMSKPQEHTPQEKQVFFVQKILAQLRMHEAFRDSVVAQARQSTPYKFVLVPQYGPKDKGDSPKYKELVGQEPDTILELSVQSFGLKNGQVEGVPHLALFMKVRVRLVRLAQEDVKYDSIFYHFSEQRTFKEWSHDHGRPFKEAITQAYGDLANRSLQRLFP